MCYKCLTVVLIIITWILFFIFTPSEYWASWLTAISTFAMTIIACKALDSWKNQQKRAKLVSLLERLNAFIQDLQYYELESTVFSKQTRQRSEANYNNPDLIKQQACLVDTEIAEEFGQCILYLKNWLIEDGKQYDTLNDLNKSLQEYRIKIFEFVEQKILFFVEMQNPAQILYGSNKEGLDHIFNKKYELEKFRVNVIKSIEKFKKDYEKLLK